MDKFYIETLSKEEIAITELEIETDYSIQRIEVLISLILKQLSDLKKYIQNKEFNTKCVTMALCSKELSKILMDIRGRFSIGIGLNSQRSISTIKWAYHNEV